MAKDICNEVKIDVLHQLNMIGFREPGYLWVLSKENDLPFVWGPVDAKDKFPVAYLKGATTKTKLFMRLKNFLTVLQLKHSRRVSEAARQASVVFSASSNSQRSFKKYMAIDSPLLNETGCYLQEHPLVDKSQKQIFDVLWVGKLDFRKQLALALQTISEIGDHRVRFHIVGGGDATYYRQLAIDLGVDDWCVWHGVVSHEEVQRLMQQFDVFFFTSVAEGTPHVVLEAIGNNLPVVCFDTCGQGDAIDDKVGRKVPLSTPKQSVRDFADILKSLLNDRALLKQMSANCKQRQMELSWEAKAKTMVEKYRRLLPQS